MSSHASDALDALYALDPGMPREQWVRIAFAAKDAGITEDEWLAWCGSAANFNKADALATYRHAKPRAGGVTSATLFMAALDAGYKPEKRERGGNGDKPRAAPTVVKAVELAKPAPADAATDPTVMWEACRAVDVHGYTTRKRIKVHGARVSSTGWLVVPFVDRDGKLQTVQSIAADGTKRFLLGAKQKGSVAIVGEPRGSSVVVIAEGFATAAAIEESSTYPTLAAGSRGALPEAARIAHYLSPQARLIIAADRGDLSTPLAAARAVGGFLAIPGPEDAPDGFDFADMRLAGATDAEIKALLDRAPPVEPLPEPPARIAAKSIAKARASSLDQASDDDELTPYITDAKGRPMPNLANVITFMESGGVGELRRDTFTGLTTWRGLPLTESAYVAMTRELQGAKLEGRRPFVKLAVSMVADALLAAVEAHSYNSCVEWLDSLPPWDGIHRCPSFFVDACGVDATDYAHGAGSYFWHGLVARMVCPGFQVDASVALIGDQGIGKTSLAKIIGGERYGEAGLAGIGEKDWVSQLRGKIVVEISELSGHTRAELETIKAVLSRSFDEYRAPYARAAHMIPRGNVFIATTNEVQFLIDPTGNRRWLPIQCKGAIALDNVSSMRELYFAESYAAWKKGLPPTWHAVRDAAQVQADHVVRDPWIDLLDEKLPSSLGDYPAAVANTLVYELLKLPADKQTGPTGRRIASVMKALGYARAKWYTGERQVRGYELDPDRKREP